MRAETMTKKLLFTLLPLLAFIAFAEIATRLTGLFVLQSRNPESVNGKPHLVACYGDSWTYGLGVAAESAYPAVLENALVQSGITDAGIINRGVPGARIEKTAERVRQDLSQEDKPQILLILIGMNDEPHYTLIARKQEEPITPKSALDRSAAYRIFKTIVVSARRRFVPALDEPQHGLTSDYFEDRLKALLSEVIEKCSLPMVLSYPMPVHPTRPQLFVKDDLILLTLAQKRSANRFGVPFIDLQPVFDRRPGDEPWLDIFFTHPNELGYAMIAKALLPNIAGLFGKKPKGDVSLGELVQPADPQKVQWPTEALFSKQKAPFTTETGQKGMRLVQSDTDADGSIDYRAEYDNGHLVRLTRFYASSGLTTANEFRGGNLVRSNITHEDGTVSDVSYTWKNDHTLVEQTHKDKNGDGVYDHYARTVNGVLVERKDDDDQDGRWEVRAMIDDNGVVYMHVGDIDGDGRNDYWEIRHEDRNVFQSDDLNRDGLPDRPLPPLHELGIENPNPNIRKIWGEQE